VRKVTFKETARKEEGNYI